MANKTTIQCPNCQAEIDVNAILYHQLEDELKQKNIAEQKKLKEEMAAQKKEYKEAFNALKSQEEAIQEQKEQFDEALKRATQQQLKNKKCKRP